MNQFTEFLPLSDYTPERDDISTLNEQTAGNFAQALLDQRFASSTVKLYLTAVNAFFEYLALELNASLNLDLVRRILKSKSPRTRRRLPQFSWDDIEQVIAYCQDNTTILAEDEKDRLIELRDRALVLTLADTGLRIHEACGLARGDFDWNRNVALITGKGDKQALVRFSRRAISAIRRYLSARAALDALPGSRSPPCRCLRATTALPENACFPSPPSPARRSYPASPCRPCRTKKKPKRSPHIPSGTTSLPVWSKPPTTSR